MIGMSLLHISTLQRFSPLVVELVAAGHLVDEIIVSTEMSPPSVPLCVFISWFEMM